MGKADSFHVSFTTGLRCGHARMIDAADLVELRAAKGLLENPGLAARLTGFLGAPIEQGFKLLPDRWSKAVQNAVDISLKRALEIAVASLGRGPGRARRGRRLHRAAVIGTGGLGSAFGLAALPLELPVSTTIMLRSIADVARSEGEDLERPETRLACLEVFALGGDSPADDAVETGYYAVRAALAATLADAATHLSQKGLSAEGGPALVRFLAAIGSRFGIVVSEKAAAMAVPAIGALGGGVVNALFIDHFNNMARGHFKIRRLERKYGKPLIRETYERL